MSKNAGSNIRPPLSDSEEEEEFDFQKPYALEDTYEEPERQLIRSHEVIKIGFNAGLNDVDFEVQLTSAEEEWFSHIRNQYCDPEFHDEAVKQLHSFYDERSNSLFGDDLFTMALKFFANDPSSLNPKPSCFSFVVIQELKNFMQGQDETKRATLMCLINDNLKMVAFNFSWRYRALFKLVVGVFELRSSVNLFRHRLRVLLSAKKYKETSRIARELHMYHAQDIDNFIVPLILQDKTQTLEEYMETAPKMFQQRLLEFLDDWLEDPETVEKRWASYIAEHDIPNTYFDKLDPKPLSKLVTRLADMWDFRAFPLPYTRFVEACERFNVIADEKGSDPVGDQKRFDAFVRKFIKIEKTQLKLVQHMLKKGAYSHAKRWLTIFDIPAEKWPEIPEEEESKSSEPELPFFNVSMPITMVETPDVFCKMLRTLDGERVVGIDVEWRIIEDSPSLIQIATPNECFLVDVALLDLKPKEWGYLGAKVFNNDFMRKLGFSLGSDIAMLNKALPELEIDFEAHAKSYVDLRTIWERLEGFKEFKLPFEDPSRTKHDLRALVERCFNRTLNKKLRMSNWSQRPLERRQIMYAAADACCLNPIYNIFCREAERLGVEI